MANLNVVREFDYAVLDTDDWLTHWLQKETDVTDHWLEVINRAHRLQIYGEHYTEDGTYRDMRDWLRKQEHARGYGEHFYAEWTGNRENILTNDLAIVAVEYMAHELAYSRILVFVETAPMGQVGVPDLVIEFDDWDSVFQFANPAIHAYCPTADHGHWESTNGMTLTNWDSGSSDVNIEDLKCPTCGDTLALTVLVED